MTTTSISDALFTKSQQRVLGLLYAWPDQSLYANEIVRRANMGRGTIKRELDRLVSAGLLTVSKSGNQLHYQANPDNPVYHELLGIVRKTIGLVDVIRQALNVYDEKIEFAFIYGSIAKGEALAKSDVDLFVASDKVAYAELMNVLSDAGDSLSRIVNPSIYSRKDIQKKLKENNAFISRVMEQAKLWVKGSDDDISELRKSG